MKASVGLRLCCKLSHTLGACHHNSLSHLWWKSKEAELSGTHHKYLNLETNAADIVVCARFEASHQKKCAPSIKKYLNLVAIKQINCFRGNLFWPPCMSVWKKKVTFENDFVFLFFFFNYINWTSHSKEMSGFLFSITCFTILLPVIFTAFNSGTWVK